MPKFPLLIRPDSRYEGPLYIDKKLLVQLFIRSITVMAFLLNNYKIISADTNVNELELRDTLSWRKKVREQMD